jgi:hypothetical protein
MGRADYLQGRATLALEPREVPLMLGGLSNQMIPPWASTIAFAIERPRPLPPWSRERD